MRFRGQPIHGRHARHRRRGIAYVPESMGIFTDLTVQENMVLPHAQARHAGELDRARLDWIFGLFPALQKFWLYPAGKLSGGQKQMLAVARAIVRAARADPHRRAEQGPGAVDHPEPDRALRELKAQQTTILLVEQNFLMAKALGDTWP
jgi:branched-chain amino acid transport system ATP-binding protein